VSAAAGDGGSLQGAVRETMIAAGGYWRPLAAVARLLEELGELAEILATGAPREEASAELADLWIITTALADQFLARSSDPAGGAEAVADLGVLVAAAAPIARVVNHYDGPKVPRSGEPMPTLHGSIAAFHDALDGFATSREIDLAASVRAKIERIHARGDIERFGPGDRTDPSTAPVLAFARAGAGGLPERLWGAPEPAPGEQTASGRARAARVPLTIFAKAARAERLDAFLIAGPTPIAAAGRAAWLGALVAELDPLGSPRRFELAAVALGASTVEVAGRSFALVRPA
jgi:hypothetical protein